MTKIGFDVISDLNLTSDESFNWEGKATSLYCIIAGNISNDLRTIRQTLLHLSHFYQGVFYSAGALEYENVPSFATRTVEIAQAVGGIRNVASLHNHVVIVDGIAIVGSNCWYGNDIPTYDITFEIEKEGYRHEDLGYLYNTIEKLQLHLDVKKIVVVTHSVPSLGMFFGEEPDSIHGLTPPITSILSDSEHKITHWIYGSYNKTVDAVIDNINYVNNSYYKRKPYWAKRIDV